MATYAPVGTKVHSIPQTSVYVQKAFNPTYLQYLKSRSRLLLNSALLLYLIHGSRYCPPRYVVIVITIAIRLVQLSLYLYLWSSSCYPTDHVTLSLSLQYLRRFHHARTTPPSSQFLKLSSRILSLFIFVVVLYIHVTNRSIQASQEFGLSPLERAYCHECVRACCPSNIAACPP
jgi:hypothetical protein